MENVRYFAVHYLKPATVNLAFYSIIAFYSTLNFFGIFYDYFFKDGKSDKHFWRPKNRPIPPKNLDDPSLGTHHYLQLPNIKLHYVESGSKDKPLMLMVHGYPEFWYSWRHQIKEFSKDYWVVAIDTRGCGDSEKPQGIQYYKLKYLIGDIKNCIEALGRKKCILVAHDWGGVIAWDFLYKYPEMVEKYVILNAPNPLAIKKHLYVSWRQFKMSWYMFFYQMCFLPEIAMVQRDMKVFDEVIFKNHKNGKVLFNEEDMEAVKYMWGKPGAFTTALNYYRANVGPFTNKYRERFAIPSADDFPKGFLIFGEEDIALDTRPLVEKSAELVPNLKTLIIPDACHFVQEDVPDVVNKAMRDFLEQ